MAFIFLLALLGCSSDDDQDSPHSEPGFFDQYPSRSFAMGFSTWPYAPTVEAVEDTYQFISDHSDIYSEHIDANIPWDAWINGSPLPQAFIDDIANRVSKRLPNASLTLSVSLLNTDRSDLASDFNGQPPSYGSMNDLHIEDAYYSHLTYIVDELQPEYLLMAIEVNELLKNNPARWPEYKLLAGSLRSRLEAEYPDLQISESFTLHNYYQIDVADPTTFQEELSGYMNSLDFVAISFYPFFVGLNDRDGFQDAFDFLHEAISRPIVFSETSHLSEDLTVESFNLSIPGSQTEQNEYMETLMINAQEKNYDYVIWWAHRDYDELWETFPADVQDLGKLWLSNGIINEDGAEKAAYDSWSVVFDK